MPTQFLFNSLPGKITIWPSIYNNLLYGDKIIGCQGNHMQ